MPPTNRSTSGAGADEPSCIDVAAEFLAAQPGAVERTMARHARRDDGYCSGCVHTLTRWPCGVAAIARSAQLLISGRSRLTRPTADRG